MGYEIRIVRAVWWSFVINDSRDDDRMGLLVFLRPGAAIVILSSVCTFNDKFERSTTPQQRATHHNTVLYMYNLVASPERGKSVGLWFFVGHKTAFLLVGEVRDLIGWPALGQPAISKTKILMALSATTNESWEKVQVLITLDTLVGTKATDVNTYTTSRLPLFIFSFYF